MAESKLLKIEFYVPAPNLDSVKTAMFAAGAGRIGNYDCCAWQTLGQGQFRPLSGSTPHIGQTDLLETVAEYKVEMVCDESVVSSVISAMKSSHPYEEVAYSVLAVMPHY